MVQFLHGETIIKHFEALRKEAPAIDLALQKQPFPDVYKKLFLRIS